MPFKCLRLLPLLLLGTFASEAMAQLPVSISLEARVGLAMPSGDFSEGVSDFAAESGPALAASATLLPIDHVGVFVGYQQSRFGCDRCRANGLDGTAVAGGPEAGIHLEHPIGTTGMAGWIRGGIVQQILTFSGFGDRMSSRPEIGFTGGAGLAIPLRGPIRILPAARYFTVPAEFEFTGFAPRSTQVSAFVLDLGLAFRF